MTTQLYRLAPLFAFLFTSALPRSEPMDPAQPGLTLLEVDARRGAGAESPTRPAGWLEEVEREIARGEYSYSSTADGACSAPNRSQDLRSRIGASGIEVYPRDTAESGVGAPWKLTLETVAFGREGGLRCVGESRLAHLADRIERHSGRLSGWYVNDERGIEQGWTILARPADSPGTPLRIVLRAAGLRARIATDGRSAVFVDDTQEARLRYGGLRAWDASERELPARLVLTATLETSRARSQLRTPRLEEPRRAI